MVGCCTSARPAGRCRAVPAGRSMAGPARPGPDRTWGLLAKQRSGRWSCAAPAVTVVVVRGVPWWGVVSSAAAPVLMVAGWTVAAGLLYLPANALLLGSWYGLAASYLPED